MRFYIAAIAKQDGKVDFKKGLAFEKLAEARSVAKNVNLKAEKKGFEDRVKVYSVGSKLKVPFNVLMDMEKDWGITDVKEISL